MVYYPSQRSGAPYHRSTSSGTRDLESPSSELHDYSAKTRPQHQGALAQSVCGKGNNMAVGAAAAVCGLLVLTLAGATIAPLFITEQSGPMRPNVARAEVQSDFRTDEDVELQMKSQERFDHLRRHGATEKVSPLSMHPTLIVHWYMNVYQGSRLDE